MIYPWRHFHNYVKFFRSLVLPSKMTHFYRGRSQVRFSTASNDRISQPFGDEIQQTSFSGNGRDDDFQGQQGQDRQHVKHVMHRRPRESTFQFQAVPCMSHADLMWREPWRNISWAMIRIYNESQSMYCTSTLHISKKTMSIYIQYIYTYKHEHHMCIHLHIDIHMHHIICIYYIYIYVYVRGLLRGLSSPCKPPHWWLDLWQVHWKKWRKGWKIQKNTAFKRCLGGKQLASMTSP